MLMVFYLFILWKISEIGVKKKKWYTEVLGASADQVFGQFASFDGQN